MMRNKLNSCLYMLSLANWLIQAASPGGNDNKLLAGVHCHGEVAFRFAIVELLSRCPREYGAGRAGSIAA